MKTKNVATLSTRKSISPDFFRGCLLIAVALCFALPPAPKAFGVSPKPDGSYPGANTAEGDSALQSLTSGLRNTALGYHTLFSNTTGTENTATGNEALSSNSTGLYNTANGYRALYSNTTGLTNTANGVGALSGNTTGNFNTATGGAALGSNTTGQQNTAIGAFALSSNTTGADNTAVGDTALSRNTTGLYNTASGFSALGNTTGDENTANGAEALFFNTTGSGNTASGVFALFSNTTGNGNIALGNFAGSNLTTGNNNIDIGNQGVAGETGTIRIGAGGVQTATFMAGIRGVTTGNSDAIAVMIDSAGQLGTISSSQRFKKEIQRMDKQSEAILALRPVTFHYKSDATGTPQFGLIAEEVAKVNPDLVVRDEDGKIYTVRYEAVNAMLLNEFLKEHRKVQEQEATISQLKKGMEVLTAQLQKQAAIIQKVSAQLDAIKSTPQIVLNSQ